MEKDPQKHVEDQEQQELDEQQVEEVAGGRDLQYEKLQRMAAAGAEKLAEMSPKDLDKIAAGRVSPDPRGESIH